eukprot:GHVT01006502.1.p1 GENE.GHVT01006502.1~~GHVT01006502.1.p1  ORF type:complete len:100 (+),score=2.14 GHVT01006502.1:171-470(+)
MTPAKRSVRRASIRGLRSGNLARLGERSGDMGPHRPGNRLDRRDHDAVAELLVGTSVANRNHEGIWETHKPRALARSEPARVLSRLLHEDLGTILVVAR